MSRKLDIPKGTEFGRLKVIKEIEPYVSPKGQKSRQFKLKCLEGNIVKVRLSDLTTGATQSCGCLSVDNVKIRGKEKSEKSGFRHPFRNRYNHMIARCEDKNHSSYLYYGERGIKVCKAWKLPDGKGFWNFVKWAEDWAKRNNIDIYSQDLEIDREDNSGNYEPNNCRWVTSKVNNRNRRSNVIVSYLGKFMTLMEAIEMHGIKGLTYTTAYQRLLRGYPIEDILTQPIGRWQNSSRKKNLNKLLMKTLEV